MSVTDPIQAYCVKCREKRPMARPILVKMKNGKDAVRGACSACGGAMFSLNPASAEAVRNG